jgi:uncharacterized membrane protein YidH (DUF202 family)
VRPAYDPGLQRERTAMAWTRTGLAVLVNALIVLRAGANEGQALVLALGSLLLAAAGAAIGCGAWRSRRLASGADPTTPWLLVATTVGIAWIASVAAVAAIFTTTP